MPAIAASTSAPYRVLIVFLLILNSLSLLFERAQPPRVESAEQRNQQDQRRQRQHHRRDRPGHQDREAALGHHQRLAQRPFHAGPERKPEDQRRRWVIELAHEISQQTEHQEESEVEQASRNAVDADE